MRIKRLAMVTGVLLVAAVAAIVIGVHVLAPRALAALSESVKTNTGRDLLFGDVGVRVLPHPTLVLQQARFGNAAWGSQPWLAQTGSISVDIDLLGLLSGRLHIRRIAAANASVLLETDSAGNGNWVIGTSQSAARTPAWLDTLEFDELSLQDVTLGYRDGTTGKTTPLHLDRLDVAGPSASQPIRFSARTTFDGNEVTATGTVGALTALFANSPAYPVDLEGKIGAAGVSVHGTVDKPRTLDGFNLALRAQAPDLADVAAAFGVNVPRGPFRAAAQLTGAAAAPLFTGLDLELGTGRQMHLTARGELQASVAADGAREWSSSGVDLAIEGSEFGDLTDWIGKPVPALGRYRIAAHAAGPLSAPALSAIDAAAGGGEMPEIDLSGAVADAHAVTGIDLKIAATAADWWHVGAAEATRLPPFRARARVRDSRDGYRIDDLDLRIADSSVSAALQLVKSGSRLRITGNAKSPLIDLSRRASTRGSVPASMRSEAPPARNYWKLADLDLDLNIRRLILPDGRHIEEGSGKIALADGHLQASALQGTFAGAKMRVDGGISEPHELAGLDLKVALQGNELSDLFKSFGKTIPPVGPYQARAELHGSRAVLAITNIDASAGRRGQSAQVSGQIDDALNWTGVTLAIDANVGDTVAAGRLFGAELPRLPAWQARARVTGAQGGYVFDDLDIELGRSSVRGRVAFAPGEPRPHVTATLDGPMLDLSALPPAQQRSAGGNPLLAVDVDADVRFDRVVLPDRRELGPVNGGMRLAAGALQLKELTVAVDGASATLDGSIDDPLKPAGIALMLTAKVSRGAGIAAFTGQRIPVELPEFSASGKLTDVADGYALTGLELAFAPVKISSEVRLLRGPKRLMLQVTASSPLLDVSGMIAPTAPESTAKPVPGARAIPEVALPLDVLRAFDADLDLRVDALTFRDATSVGPLQVRATIADGRLTAEPVELEAGTGQTLRASATVDAGKSAWTLQLDGSGINLGEMFARFGLPKALTGGSAELALELRAHGKSLRALLASLNGKSLLKVGPLRVNNFAVGLGEGIIARLFSMANPFQKTDPDTEVKCVAGRLQIADGVLTSQNSVAVETAKYNLLMNGTVNLRTEGLDVVVTPVVTSGLGVGDVSTIVRLSGTFAEPSVGLTAAGAVKSVASLGATLTLPGVGQLVGSIFKKAISDPNPCTTALAQGTDGK